MELVTSRESYADDLATAALVRLFREFGDTLGLKDAAAYTEFPLYKDDDGNVASAKVVIASRSHGLIVIETCNATDHLEDLAISIATKSLEEIFGFVYSKAIRSKQLRAGMQSLAFPAHAILYAPFVSSDRSPEEFTGKLINSDAALAGFLRENTLAAPLSEPVFLELRAVIEGSKGLIKPKKRDLEKQPPSAKGSQAAAIEAEIASFDLEQRRAYIRRLDGTHRIRGLAGSGKTIILALKAAITHLQKPDAQILYTYYTKSLHQHIKRLITRFYRQFDDQDPDWTKIHILHAWGGQGLPGVYSTTCRRHGVSTISYREAASVQPGTEFDYVVAQLLKKATPEAVYDYVFVDEAQDVPASFLKLAYQLAREGKFIYAYDELQTLFQTETPSAEAIFGKDNEGKPLVDLKDTVLHKCYRNPREILVIAHAIGFGIYGPRIVQMLENAEHWRDIGYTVQSEVTTQDRFVEGQDVVIERPPENSLQSIAAHSSMDDIVSFRAFDKYINDEIEYVASGILGDIADGLRADDILVVTVDDKNAPGYLDGIERALVSKGVNCHNMRTSADPREFSHEGQVTLSTVHKAKGNEAFMVYVVGADAVFVQGASMIRKRNMLFTAMTRAKGWVRVSATGPNASLVEAEINAAKRNFPLLKFKYPNEQQLKMMRRDREQDAKRIEMERVLRKAAEHLTEEEFEAMLAEAMATKREESKALIKPRRGE